MTLETTHQIVADWLAESRFIVAFTGAGISTESGIPDFRSPGGIWSQSQPVMYQDFLASAEARYEYWRQKSLSHRDFEAAEPNAGHRILAKWEQQGRLHGVITQNIDGLHESAGSRNVLQLHGTARQIACLDCGVGFDADPWVKEFLENDRVPSCPECGGLLKHATISFGQSLPPDVLRQASQWTQDCDLLLVMGSSLVVEPAASMPRLAQQSGAKLVIINRDPTDQDSLADAVLQAGIGETLAEIDKRIA